MNSVLIIDDQETEIMILTNILNHEYTVYKALNGKDGIILAEEHKPEVILLDILMVGMDGYDVLSALKESDKTRHIPVIFITALNDDKHEVKGLALGAADYISKPFLPEIVTLRVRNQIKLIEQMRIIEKLSMIDQLTELPNRRNFEDRINSEWGRAVRENLSVSILIIDIDHFKNYNDSHGHQQGDIALKTSAKVFMETLKRPGDFVARWGGEEFIVLLPNTDRKGALEIAEKIRKQIEDMIIPCPDKSGEKLTVSIGVNSKESVASDITVEGQCGTIHEFILKADTALYEAKSGGRNKISFNKTV